MSNKVSYQGRVLGRLYLDSGLEKKVYVSNGLDFLGILLCLDPSAVIVLETDDKGKVNMPYLTFKKDYLDNVDVIYPSQDAWTSSPIKGPTSYLMREG